MIGWIRDLFAGGPGRAELVVMVEQLEADNARLREEMETVRRLCRALRDVNRDLDQRIQEGGR